MPGHVPATWAAGEFGPVLGGIGHVGRLVDLLHLGGVFGDEAVRLDEIGEDVVAGAVSADAPLDVEAVLLHAAGAAHQPVDVGHLVCRLLLEKKKRRNRSDRRPRTTPRETGSPCQARAQTRSTASTLLPFQ